MEHIDKLAEKIRKYAQDNVNVHDQEMVSYGIRLEIVNHVNEVLNVCKNIKETSIGNDDLNNRIVDLSEKSGMFLPHLTKICS